METKKIKKNSALATYRRLLSYLYPYRWRFTCALLAMSVYGATDGAVPYILKRVLDDIFGKQDKVMLKELVVIIIAFAFIRGAFGFMERFLIASVGHNIVRDIRNGLQKHLLQMSAAFFSNHPSGGLISRMTNDTLTIRTALTDAAGAALRDVVRIIALLTVAIYLDPVLGAIAFLGFPLAIIPVLRFGKKVRKFSRIGQERFGGLTGILHETVAGNRVVTLFSQQDTEYERFRAENQRITDTFLRAEKYGALSGPTNEMLASLAIAAVILYGGMSVMSGVRTQGDFIAFITAMLLLYEPLKKLGRLNTVVQSGITAAERIFELLDTESEITDRPNAITLASAHPRIEFESVWFRYPKGGEEAEVKPEKGDVANEQHSSEWALADVSLVIEPGSTVALVGMSGGGKSTIASLVPRIYDVTEGSIKIDGIDVRDYTLESLRSSIAVVSQNTFLFNSSVASNIAYGRPTASLEEIKAIAEAANAHEFISRLPEGYDTIIGEGGLRLSGGERARIAIARALLRDAPLLVLDEATASLDSESEDSVQSALDILVRNRTVLVIAHRLSTIRDADKILVISRGRVVEEGTHEVLLARGGEYSKFYRLQFRDEMQPEIAVG